jgi:cyclophilin family peptidyl-prolyl cis-trans isomerase
MPLGCGSGTALLVARKRVDAVAQYNGEPAASTNHHFASRSLVSGEADSGIFLLHAVTPPVPGEAAPGYEFASETDGTESTLAMANGGPGTNGSQFFLVWADSTNLHKKWNFTLFGRMDKALRDVVASMAEEGQDGSNPDGTGRPNNPSEILTVTRA